MRELPDLTTIANAGQGALKMVCGKCTWWKVYGGNNAHEGAEKAKKDGWVIRGGKSICPTCPK